MNDTAERQKNAAIERSIPVNPYVAALGEAVCVLLDSDITPGDKLERLCGCFVTLRAIKCGGRVTATIDGRQLNRIIKLMGRYLDCV